ncbi:hypothetical protein QFC22_005198 [Naganishia vaughanmartiniae]|uniref:Uncharacterized protein n=1 Tax=Naganishia vaughanmartiniae TaxID=1424756 RepID=A0ACC2WWA8_9TREE|nr:hypothetical protein QFC22_005198 [Naganishia vaughanmartiniae]
MAGTTSYLDVSFSPTTLLLCFSCIVVALLIHTKRNAKTIKSGLRWAPSPPGYPIVGNLPDIIKAANADRLHLLIQTWAKEYGPVVKVSAGRIDQYFINEDKAVKEILDKHSATTSDRPRWIYSNEYVCDQKNVLLLSASHPRWKNQRKMINSMVTSPAAADAALPLNNFETARFLHAVIADPLANTPQQNVWAKLKRYQYSLFALQTFGFPINNEDSPSIDFIFCKRDLSYWVPGSGSSPLNALDTDERTDSVFESIKGTLPGARIVETFPILEKLPMALKPWARAGRDAHERDLMWCRERMQRCKDAIAKGTALPYCTLARLLQDPKLGGLDSEDEAAYINLELIGAAADTSMMTMWGFLEAMLSYPAIQKKAQAEIDATVPDRLPVWEDLDDMPYLRCIMKEVWRWRPPVALGHPHVAQEDLEYEGIHIPKGAFLHLNAWAIHHSENRHKDPDAFIPERYEGDERSSQQSINLADPTQRDHFAFGAGRRICPGYHVAERSFFVGFSRLLWAFDIKPKPNAKLPLPHDSGFNGIMPGSRSKDLPFMLVLRDESRRSVIEQEYQQEMANFEVVLGMGDL